MPHLKQNARKLLSFIEKNKDLLSPLLILTHDYPDPDAIASAYALQHILEAKYGLPSKMAYGGIVGRTENKSMVRLLNIPIRKLNPADFKKYKNTALVDTQPGFKNNSFPNKRRAAIVIDQHFSDKKPPADFVLIDTECGATSTLLAQALLLSHIEIPTPLATALVYGILTDTLYFFRSHDRDIVQTYLDIVSNCDMKILAEIQNPEHTADFFKILRRGIKVAKIFRHLIVSHLEEIKDPDSIPQVADLLLTYRGAAWSLCTGRYKGALRVSLRIAKKGETASDILRDVFPHRGEAGGHETIAGGSFKVGMKASEETWQNAENDLVQKLIKRLRLPMKGEFYHPFK